MPTKTKPKLKPCPFCGCKGYRARVVGAMNFVFVYKVECRDEACEVRPATDWFSKQTEADKAWNQRAKC